MRLPSFGRGDGRAWRVDCRTPPGTPPPVLPLTKWYLASTACALRKARAQSHPAAAGTHPRARVLRFFVPDGPAAPDAAASPAPGSMAARSRSSSGIFLRFFGPDEAAGGAASPALDVEPAAHVPSHFATAGGTSHVPTLLFSRGFRTSAISCGTLHMDKHRQP